MTVSALRHSVLAALMALLSGCGFLGKGQDQSELSIDHNCDVDITQAAKVQDLDKSRVVESIEISPDCTTTIKFEQDVGGKLLEEKNPSGS